MSIVKFYTKQPIVVAVAKLLFNRLSKVCDSYQISDIAKTTSGGTPDRHNSGYYGGDIPWLKSGELNDSIITDYEETITEDGLKNSSAKPFPAGTLLVAMYGATAGKTGILSFQAATNQAICAVFPQSQVMRDYLYWYFRQQRLDFLTISKGGAQPNISQTVIGRALIPVPDLKTQQQIVDALVFIEKNQAMGDSFPDFVAEDAQELFNLFSFYNALQTELDQQDDLLKKLQQAILQDAVQGKLTARWREQHGPATETGADLLARIQAEKAELVKAKKLKKEKPLPPITDAEKPFELPEGWVWCRLGEVCNYLNGYAFKSSWFSSSGIRLVRNTNIGHGFLEWSDEAKLPESMLKEFNEFILEEGDIVLSLDRPIISTGLKIAQIKSHDLPCLLLQRVLKINPVMTHSGYFYRWFNTNLFLGSINPGRSIGIPHVSHKEVMNAIFPLPPLAEQRAIVEAVERAMEKLGQLREELTGQREQAGELLKALLHKAFHVGEEVNEVI